MPFAVNAFEAKGSQRRVANAGRPGGSAGIRWQSRGERRGFTLVELVVVMTLLAVIMGVVAPTLSRFFSGRSVEEEARRFQSLTRFARNESISSGFPLLLWIDRETRRYGLTRADRSLGSRTSGSTRQAGHGAGAGAGSGAAVMAREYELPKGVELLTDDVPLIEGTSGSIRFWPDGTIDVASVDLVFFRDKKAGRLLGIRRHEFRPSYELFNLDENALPSTVR